MPETQKASNHQKESNHKKKWRSSAWLWFVLYGIVVLAGLSIGSCYFKNGADRAKFWVEGLLSAGVLSVVIVQAVIYSKQWKAMASSLDIERAKSNPRLRISRVRVENLKVGSEPTFIVTITNDGLIDATGVRLHIDVKLGDDKELNWNRDPVVMIPARGSESYPVRFRSKLSHENVVGFIEQGVPLRVEGYFTYWPDGSTRFFCYKYFPWHGETERPPDIPQFVPCDYDPGLNIGLKLGTGHLKLTGFASAMIHGKATRKSSNQITPSGEVANVLIHDSPPNEPQTNVEEKEESEETNEGAN
jgi:hypothetical protein